MLLNIPVIVDSLQIQEGRQLRINENWRRYSARRKERDSRIGGQVLVKVFNPKKLDQRAEGPFVIIQIFTNGSVE